MEENKELENALKNIQLPKEEIKKLEVNEISKIFKNFSFIDMKLSTYLALKSDRINFIVQIL